MRLVCLSDTHASHRQLEVPDGDVLVHAGDFTRVGDVREVAAFGAWLADLPHRHKLVVAGNHEFLFERQPSLARATLGDVTYLEDGGVELDGLTFWGSPWQPRFNDWAFNLDRGAPLERVWERAPSGVDVLVTHTPPAGVLDRTRRGEDVGCEALAAALPRIAPRLHVFGHIHEARGVVEADGRLSINASNCGRGLAIEHAAVVIDLDPGVEAARIVS